MGISPSDEHLLKEGKAMTNTDTRLAEFIEAEEALADRRFNSFKLRELRVASDFDYVTKWDAQDYPYVMGFTES